MSFLNNMDPGDRHVFYYSQPELIKFCSSGTVVSSQPPLSNGNFFNLVNRRNNDEIKIILVG